MIRPTIALLVTLSAAVLLPGCATGFQKLRPDEGVAADSEASLLEIWGDEQRLQFSKRVQVALPAKLAVTEVRDAPWHERPQVSERRRVGIVRTLTADAQTYSDVVSLSGPTDQRGRSAHLEGLRAAASHYQADLLLLVERDETIESRSNWLAVTKLLILPIWLFPTEEHRLQVSLRMAVLDVRNGLIYTTVDEIADTTVSSTAAGAGATIEDTFDTLFDEAVESMRGHLATKLRSYATSPADG